MCVDHKPHRGTELADVCGCILFISVSTVQLSVAFYVYLVFPMDESMLKPVSNLSGA